MSKIYKLPSVFCLWAFSYHVVFLCKVFSTAHRLSINCQALLNWNCLNHLERASITPTYGIIVYTWDNYIHIWCFCNEKQMTLPEKFVLNLIPAVGACLSIVDLIFLWKKDHNSHFVGYHKWFNSCSELMLWVSFLIFSCQLQCSVEFNAFNCL